jgi:general secretion pathway protein G
MQAKSTMSAPASRGFTLIELLITLGIVGLLASVAVPMTQLTVKRQKEAELRTALKQIRGALDAYKQAYDEGRLEKKVDASGYPPNLEILVSGAVDVRTPERRPIHFLRRIPRDPLCQCSSKSAADTWGLRSYKSPADRPEKGEDVFDVYSLARGEGLNGIPYREW